MLHRFWTCPLPSRLSLPALTLPALNVVLGVASAAALATLMSRWLPPESLALLFVAPIVLVSIRHGLTASLAASVLSVLAVNYLFVEPRYTFVVARPQDGAALLVFAVVAAISSALAARARLAAQSAEARAAQAARLQRLAAELAASQDERAVGVASANAFAQLSQKNALFVTMDGSYWGAGFDQGAGDAARWSMAEKQPFKASPDAPISTDWAFWPVLVGGRAAAAVGTQGPIKAELESSAKQIAALAALALARVAASQSAARAQLETARERLKSDLLAGVSHDLRTPLSTILFTLQSLRRFAADHPPEARDELLSLAEREAERLSEMVSALLDASRIGVDGAPVRMGAIAPNELIARAIETAGAETMGGAIEYTNIEGLPLVCADPDLAVRALINVLSNARRHGGGKVKVEAHDRARGVEITVRDHGAGLGANPERLFEPFVRGAEGDGRAPGLGLGLAITRKFLEAQGASIVADDSPGGGALFTICFARSNEETSDAG